MNTLSYTSILHGFAVPVLWHRLEYMKEEAQARAVMMSKKIEVRVVPETYLGDSERSQAVVDEHAVREVLSYNMVGLLVEG